MLFFSFSVTWGSETGLGEGGGQRERGAEFGPIWVPGKSYAPFSHLTGVDSGKRTLPRPRPQVDLHIVRTQSTELIFAFSWMPQGPNFWDWGLVLERGVL